MGVAGMATNDTGLASIRVLRSGRALQGLELALLLVKAPQVVCHAMFAAEIVPTAVSASYKFKCGIAMRTPSPLCKYESRRRLLFSQICRQFGGRCERMIQCR